MNLSEMESADRDSYLAEATTRLAWRVAYSAFAIRRCVATGAAGYVVRDWSYIHTNEQEDEDGLVSFMAMASITVDPLSGGESEKWSVIWEFHEEDYNPSSFDVFMDEAESVPALSLVYEDVTWPVLRRQILSVPQARIDLLRIVGRSYEQIEDRIFTIIDNWGDLLTVAVRISDLEYVIGRAGVDHDNRLEKYGGKEYDAIRAVQIIDGFVKNGASLHECWLYIGSEDDTESHVFVDVSGLDHDRMPAPEVEPILNADLPTVEAK